MKIQKNPEILAFMERCHRNIQQDYKNDFLGMTIRKKDEKTIQRALQKAGFAEFANIETCPSLFLSTQEWYKSPYHQHIHLENIADQHFSYRQVKLRGNELFNSDVIQKDPQRELNDWMKLRAMDDDFEAIYLYQGKKEWMLDAPSEANTNDPYAYKAKGKVLSFGLGIGYFAFMCSQNEAVKEIIIIERSKEVIRMFEKYLLPQFPQKEKIRLVQGDAFDYFTEAFVKNADYVYVDIWQNHQDGLVIIEKLLEKYLPELAKVDFWIEDSCVAIMWNLIFLYFDSLLHHRKMKVAKGYQALAQKIQWYFENIPHELTKVEELKNYMYDRQTIREILAQKRK